jgi:predicted ATPase/class 3 adenylate cyclase
MTNLPTGTVTFLFTDIEGSTRLLQQLGERYAEVLAEHRRLLRVAIYNHGGYEMDTQGDGCFFAFAQAKAGLAAAIAAQRAITGHPWPAGITVRVRMGLHTGEPLTGKAGYVGVDVHRTARICAIGHGGQVLLSQTTRDLVADNLPKGMRLRDLGQHRLRDLGGPQSLFQVVAAELPSDFPALKSLDALPNNLPIQLTSFIGREREKAEVRRLLSDTRLLTLTGAGGAGKTRLALQVAAELLEDYPDGVWLVELAAVSDPALVPQALASALGISEQPNHPLREALREYLRPKSLLLVLDNCEHLLPACAQLVDAHLRTCPSLRILATSREALRIAGETSWRVPSMSLPAPRCMPPFERLMEYEAVRLFVERARAVSPAFTVTTQNAGAIVRVCLQLDGIPLAIELAAPRVKVLTVEQIAVRLDDRFRLLSGGSRTALPRQQTLRATMDWSYDLLSDKERAFLCRLSVFAGGWTLEAAEAVCSGADIEGSDILDLLTQLVDKSLAVMETQDGEVRYRLQETVRRYGLGKLQESGKAPDVRRRHLAWCLGTVERMNPTRAGSDPALWRERLEGEHDNLRAALEWSLGSGEPQAGLQLAVAAFYFWWRGHFDEGRYWLEESLAVNDKTPSPLRARALVALGDIVREQGEYRRAAEVYEESLRLHREQGDERGIADVLQGLGRLAWRRSDYEHATAFFEESLALNQKLGRKAQIADNFNALGNVAHAQGDYQRAAALHKESVSLHRALNNTSGLAIALDSLGNAEWRRGNHEQATVLLEESLTLLRKQAFKRGIAVALLSLGTVALSGGHYERAKASFEESLGLRRELGDKRGVASVLDKLGILTQSLDHHERAAQLFGAADIIREGIGAPLTRSGRADRERSLEVVRGALGDTAFAAAWTAGRAMTLDQATEYALTPAKAPPAKPH